MTHKNHPGVYIPPPLIYVGFFFLGKLFMHFIPISMQSVGKEVLDVMRYILFSMGLLLIIPAISRFLRSRNTLITIKPANSLQTKGIFRFSRNPMYLGLLCLYTAAAIWKENTWALVLLPLLIVTVRFYIIDREEKYLELTFKNEFLDYRKKVRRWL